MIYHFTLVVVSCHSVVYIFPQHASSPSNSVKSLHTSLNTFQQHPNDSTGTLHPYVKAEREQRVEVKAMAAARKHDFLGKKMQVTRFTGNVVTGLWLRCIMLHMIQAVVSAK